MSSLPPELLFVDLELEAELCVEDEAAVVPVDLPEVCEPELCAPKGSVEMASAAISAKNCMRTFIQPPTVASFGLARVRRLSELALSPNASAVLSASNNKGQPVLPPALTLTANTMQGGSSETSSETPFGHKWTRDKRSGNIEPSVRELA